MTPMKFNFPFFSLLVTGTLLACSASNWFIAWIGLEMNLMAFLPLISSIDKITLDASIKYFFPQTVASMGFLLTAIWHSHLMNSSPLLLTSPLLPLILTTSLLMKLGSSPLHFWFPPVMAGVGWPQAAILMTWQKLAPLTLLMKTPHPTYILILSASLSCFVGALGGLNQLMLKNLMAYSSISHLGWLLMAPKASLTLAYTYFTIYSLVSLSIIITFYNYNLSHLMQLLNMPFNPAGAINIINLLSIAGLPPLLGFFPKWLLVKTLIMAKLFFLSLILIGSSVITLYFYLRLSHSISLLSLQKNTFPSTSKPPSMLIPIFPPINLLCLPMLIHLFS